jgi:hypothetical protein
MSVLRMIERETAMRRGIGQPSRLDRRHHTGTSHAQFV